jgi:hypothetical protein
MVSRSVAHPLGWRLITKALAQTFHFALQGIQAA